MDDYQVGKYSQELDSVQAKPTQGDSRDEKS